MKKTQREIEMMKLVKSTATYEIYREPLTDREYMLVKDGDGNVIYSCRVIEKID